MTYETTPTDRLKSELADIEDRIKRYGNSYHRQSVVTALKGRRDKIKVELRKRDSYNS